MNGLYGLGVWQARISFNGNFDLKVYSEYDSDATLAEM